MTETNTRNTTPSNHTSLPIPTREEFHRRNMEEIQPSDFNTEYCHYPSNIAGYIMSSLRKDQKSINNN